MADKPPVYVVITQAGHVWRNMPKIGGDSFGQREPTYWEILAAIHKEHQSAGGSWDPPWRLLCNGEMVVSEKLADLAYEFGKASYDAQVKAVEKTRKAHWPAWLEPDS